MTRLNRSRNALLGLALIAAAGAPLQAALANPDHCGPHREHARFTQTHFQHWQARLKSDLHLKQDQMAAWQNFTQVTEANARSLRPHPLGPGQSKCPASAPDRLQARIGFARQRLDAMEKLQGALRQLYAKLSPTQRTILDLELHPHHGPRHWR